MNTAIQSGFKNDRTSDFQIICGDRVFEVHEVILREQKFFAGVFSAHANWREMQDRRLTLEIDDPTTCEFLLKYLYNLPFAKLCEQFRPPRSRLRNLKARTPGLKTATLRLLATPARPNGHKIESGMWYKFEGRTKADPEPEVSAYHCVELLHLAKLHVLADMYQINELEDKTSQAFANLLCDCWNSSDILEIVEFVISNAREGSQVRKVLEKGLQERVDVLIHEPKFQALVHDSHEVAEFFALLERPDNHAPGYSGLVYCSSYKCRRNVQSKLNRRNTDHRTCKECKESRWVSDAKARLWQHQNSGSAGVPSAEPDNEDTEPQAKDVVLIEVSKNDIELPSRD